MTLSPLAARIAALRESSDTSTVSASTNTTPLETYVRLYNKARGSEQGGGSCYTNYMEGAKLLYTYLSPISVDHSMVFKSSPMPEVFHAYEVQRLTEILAGGMQAENFNYIANCVIYYTAKHVIEDMI